MAVELDLVLLSSIYLGSWTFEGDDKTVESNELIMRSIDCCHYLSLLDLPSLTHIEGYGWNFCNIGKATIESGEDNCV